ncbi:transposase [Acidithiobacillus sp.]|uniref:transposase n=1 Tax=Acidithiobacillus sp. TaxID=1872118 RepID=UPI003438B041
MPSIRKILTVVCQEIETIRRQIQEHIDDHPDLHSKKELLLSIPGIGEATIATLLAFLSPFERFESPKQMVAYAGLNPRIRQSGQWNVGRLPSPRRAIPSYARPFICPPFVQNASTPSLRSFVNDCSLVESAKCR